MCKEIDAMTALKSIGQGVRHHHSGAADSFPDLSLISVALLQFTCKLEIENPAVRSQTSFRRQWRCVLAHPRMQRQNPKMENLRKVAPHHLQNPI